MPLGELQEDLHLCEGVPLSLASAALEVVVRTTDEVLRMKVISLLSMLLFWALFPPSAGAGAATGTPSPFLPPYPDFWRRGKCLWHSGMDPQRRAIAAPAVANAHMRLRATDKARKRP